MRKIKDFFFHIKSALRWAKIGYDTYNWDWMYLLDIEKVKLEDMRDYFETADITYSEKEHYRDIVIALKCIDIINGRNDILILKDYDDNILSGKFYLKDNAYVNVGNSDRFIKNVSDRLKKYEKEGNVSMVSIIKSDIRVEKAWNLYNKIRTEKMRTWWD